MLFIGPLLGCPPPACYVFPLLSQARMRNLAPLLAISLQRIFTVRLGDRALSSRPRCSLATGASRGRAYWRRCPLQQAKAISVDGVHEPSRRSFTSPTRYAKGRELQQLPPTSHLPGPGYAGHRVENFRGSKSFTWPAAPRSLFVGSTLILVHKDVVGDRLHLHCIPTLLETLETEQPGHTVLCGQPETPRPGSTILLALRLLELISYILTLT